MKLSARNQLKATVKKIVAGAINAEVILDLGGGQTITSIITNDSVASLGLREGQVAYAVIKASSVLIGVD
ncbi:MAG TPA: TOBE domain-containing protein [Holophaga sp.]|mgnify:CR=1 FL=1|jgi:molybdopterin-binding protein|nr:TOBE domain-containing protein [Holophaga sp.]